VGLGGAFCVKKTLRRRYLVRRPTRRAFALCCGDKGRILV
jgi:hypothetical protein